MEHRRCPGSLGADVTNQCVSGSHWMSVSGETCLWVANETKRGVRPNLMLSFGESVLAFYLAEADSQ